MAGSPASRASPYFCSFYTHSESYCKTNKTIGQGAFMLSNAMLGTLEAYCGSSPMLILTDLSDGAPFSHHAPYQAGTGDYRTWDAKRCFGGVTKIAMELHDAAQAVQGS